MVHTIMKNQTEKIQHVTDDEFEHELSWSEDEIERPVSCIDRIFMDFKICLFGNDNRNNTRSKLKPTDSYQLNNDKKIAAK